MRDNFFMRGAAPVRPWRPSMISLCMIALNEEEYIAGCLESAAGAVDEIILVDTGSKDRTVQIAESFGAKIFPFSWRDDFSAARNESLRHATGDWILVLDADEELTPEAVGMIREAPSQWDRAAFYLPLVNLLEDGRRMECLMVRLFPNRPDIRFRYLIHEQVLPDITHYSRKAGKPLGILRAEILHKGYQSHVIQGRAKTERNRRIFKKQLGLYPRDVYSWYKYAEFLRISGAPRHEIGEALIRTHAFLRELPREKARSHPFSGEVSALLSLEILDGKKDPQEALRILNEGVEAFAHTPHLFFVKAGVEKALGRLEDAVASYERCLEFDSKEFMVPVTQGVNSWQALTGIGLCRMDLGDLEGARTYLERSIRLYPDQHEPYAALAEMEHKKGNPSSALQWLMDLLQVRPEYRPAWEVGSQFLDRMGLAEQAGEWRKRAIGCGNTIAESPLHRV